MRAILEQALAKHQAGEIAEGLITSGVPCASVRDIDAVVADPHRPRAQ
ncbi:CoA transferase [Mesorhizobium sp. L-8-3]|nr:CoA transferase [Mesorhizobium sp. L-8-3]